MVSTLLARIRSAEPAAEITWLCGTTAGPLVELLDGVDRVITFDEQRIFLASSFDRMSEMLKVWRSLGFARFTRVFLVHVDPRYRALILPLVGSPVATLDRRAGGDMNPIPGRYLGDEYARLFDGIGHTGPIAGQYPLGRLKTDERAPVRPAGSSRRVAIVPGGAKNVLRE